MHGLPVVHEAAAAPVQVAPAADVGGGSQTILLAEDDGAVRRLARDILANTSGYTENVMMRSGFENGLTLLAKPFLAADLLRKVKETLGTTA